VQPVLARLRLGYLMERQARTGGDEIAWNNDSVMRVGAVGELASENVSPEQRDLSRVVGVEANPNTVVLVVIVYLSEIVVVAG
jgi:hypothetical protein